MTSRADFLARWILALMMFSLVLAVLPFTPNPAIDIKVLLYEWGAFCALGVWLLGGRGMIVAGSSPVAVLVGAFLTVHLAATLFSQNPAYSFSRSFIQWFALFLLFLVSSKVYHSARQAWSLIAIICLTFFAASLYGVAQSRGLDPFPWQDEKGLLLTAPATFGNPNVASHALIPVILLALGMSSLPRGRWALLLVPVYLYHFSLTQTRGSLAGLVGGIVLALVALACAARVKSPSRAVTATVLVASAGAVSLLAGVAAVTMARTGQPYPDDPTLTIRYHAFYGAARMIQDKPLLGHGPGMYAMANAPYWTPLEQAQLRDFNRQNYHVHNEPLEIAVDAGLPAGALYLAILTWSLAQGLLFGLTSQTRSERALAVTLAAVFFAFLIDGLFGFNVHAPVSGVLVFLLAGVLQGVSWETRGIPKRSHSLFARTLLIALAASIPVLGVRDFWAQVQHQRGQGAVAYHEMEVAAACFAAAAQLAPYDWSHYHHWGVAAISGGRIAEGADHLARAVALNPSSITSVILLARAKLDLASQTRNATAEELLLEASRLAQRVVDLNPLLPDGQDLLGTAKFRRAQRDGSAPALSREAEVHLRRAIVTGNRRPDRLYRLIALARSSRGDIEGAQEALVSALLKVPESVETWKLLRQLCRQGRDFAPLLDTLDWGIAHLTRTGRHSDVLGTLRILRAEVLFEGYGDGDGAAEAFIRLAHDYPAHSEVWAAFSDFVAVTEQRDLFFGALSSVLANHGMSSAVPPAVAALALAVDGNTASLGAAAAALAAHARLLGEQGVSEATRHEELAWAADALEARMAAVAALESTTGRITRDLARVRAAYGDLVAAAHLYRHAASVLSDDERIDCLLEWGSVMIAAGNAVAALEAVQQAADEAPGRLDARYALAAVLAQDGQVARARLEFLYLLSAFSMDAATRARIEGELQELPVPGPDAMGPQTRN